MAGVLFGSVDPTMYTALLTCVQPETGTPISREELEELSKSVSDWTTVNQLIRELKRYPKHMLVVTYYEDHDTGFSLSPARPHKIKMRDRVGHPGWPHWFPVRNDSKRFGDKEAVLL